MPIRRRVTLSAAFIERACELYPQGGSPDGRPSFELFRQTVCQAAMDAFAHDFEGQQADIPESPIRMVLTAAVPFFPCPMVFYALLAEADVVELVDLVVDEEWGETWDEDFGD